MCIFTAAYKDALHGMQAGFVAAFAATVHALQLVELTW